MTNQFAHHSLSLIANSTSPTLSAASELVSALFFTPSAESRSVASHSCVTPALLNCRVDCIADRGPLFRGNANALVRLVVSLLTDNDKLPARFVNKLNDRRQFREQLIPLRQHVNTGYAGFVFSHFRFLSHL